MKRFGLFGLFALALALGFGGCTGGNEAASKDPQPTTGIAKAAEPVDLQFEIRNAPDSLVKFVGIIGSTNYMVDSMFPQAGKLILKRDTALPAGLYFLIMPNDVVFQFLLDQDQSFSLKADFRSPIQTAQIEGSLDNELLYQNLAWEQSFQSRFAPIEAQYRNTPAGDPNQVPLKTQLEALVAERKAHIQTYRDKHPDAFFTQYKLAGQNPELHDIRLPDGAFDEDRRIFLYRNEFWDNTPLNDPRFLRTPIIVNKLNTYITQITPQTHDSVVKYADLLIEKARVNKENFKFIVNWITIYYHTPKNMGLESVFVHLVDKYFTDQEAFWSTSDELKEIRREVNEMRPSLVGKTGQDLVCTNLKGQEESFYSLKGKANIVFIWNYECEHCQEQAPEMRKIYDRYHSRGLEIYSLCTGVDEAEARKFVDKYGITPFHNVIDPQYKSDFYRKYHVDITPECYVMDANHKIVCKDLQPNQLPEILEPMLK